MKFSPATISLSVAFLVMAAVASTAYSQGSASYETAFDCLSSNENDWPPALRTACKQAKKYNDLSLEKTKAFEVENKKRLLAEDNIKRCKADLDGIHESISKCEISKKNHESLKNELDKAKTAQKDSSNQKDRAEGERDKAIARLRAASFAMTVAFGEDGRQDDGNCLNQKLPTPKPVSHERVDCEGCGELIWLSFNHGRQDGVSTICPQKPVGFGMAPVAVEQFVRCETETACTVDPFARSDLRQGELVRNVTWLHAQQYLAWLNADLVLQGYWARLPRKEEWDAVVEATRIWPPASRTPPPHLLANLPRTDLGLRALPESVREWTQNCAKPDPNGGCLARYVYGAGASRPEPRSSSGPRPAADTQDQRIWSAMSFRVVVEELPPLLKSGKGGN